MRLFLLTLLILLAACTLQPVRDDRTPEQASATRTARPLPALYEGRLRIVLERPPIDIAPAVAPQPTVSLVPTVTPTPEVSE